MTWHDVGGAAGWGSRSTARLVYTGCTPTCTRSRDARSSGRAAAAATAVALGWRTRVALRAGSPPPPPPPPPGHATRASAHGSSSATSLANAAPAVALLSRSRALTSGERSLSAALSSVRREKRHQSSEPPSQRRPAHTPSLTFLILFNTVLPQAPHPCDGAWRSQPTTRSRAPPSVPSGA